jgi:hypothetical protein
MIEKTVSKSAPDNSFRQSLKRGFFKNTGKQVFFANTCFDDKFLRILFFFDVAAKEGEHLFISANTNKSYDDYKTRNDFFKVWLIVIYFIDALVRLFKKFFSKKNKQ